MKADIKSMTPEELKSFVTGELQEPGYRAGQIFAWLYRGARSFDQMSDLSLGLRTKLEDKAYINTLSIERKQVSKDGTVKYLFRLMDGEHIESVVMRYEHGFTICVSSQVGCRMGCRFCASTLGGLKRNLTPAEIIDQVLAANQDLGITISNIVMMGMGEPLDNYENVLKFLEIVNNPKGLNIGIRHISLSTCGLCDKIEQLREKNLGLTLSVSLHAPNDILRDEIMPVNKSFHIKRLLDTCRAYAEATHRRISFEYTLIEGKTDTPACAEELARKLKGMLCHVNLIPVNPVRERGYRASSRERVRQFQEILERHGITATVRRRLGADIDASCGQLRHKHENQAIQ